MFRAAFAALLCIFAASSEAAVIENADGLEEVIASGDAAAVLWVSKDREGQEDLHKLVELAEEELNGKLKVCMDTPRTRRASSNPSSIYLLPPTAAAAAAAAAAEPSDILAGDHVRGERGWDFIRVRVQHPPQEDAEIYGHGAALAHSNRHDGTAVHGLDRGMRGEGG